MESIRLIKGQTVQLRKPENFSDKVFGSTGFLRYDGNFLKNAGYYKIKRELRVGEEEGERKSEETKAEHLLEIEKVSAQEICIRAKNKGKVAVVLKDHTGKEKKRNGMWKFCMKIPKIYQMCQKMILEKFVSDGNNY